MVTVKKSLTEIIARLPSTVKNSQRQALLRLFLSPCSALLKANGERNGHDDPGHRNRGHRLTHPCAIHPIVQRWKVLAEYLKV